MSASDLGPDAPRAARANPLRRLYHWVLHWADTRYGTPALALVSFAESSFFPIPPDVLQIALSEQTGGRAVIEVGVEPLEPDLGHLPAVGVGDYLGDLQGQAQALLGGGAGLATAGRPLVDGASLLDGTQVGNEARPEQVAERDDHAREGGTDCLSMGDKLRSWGWSSGQRRRCSRSAGRGSNPWPRRRDSRTARA